jgi:hypothetical protein
MLFTIDKKDYTSLFSIDKKDTLKNIITEYKDINDKLKKKITASTLTLKINNFKSLVSMRYSTTSNKKIDVTNKISNYYFLKNNKELLTLQMLTKEFNKFLHLYISYFCGRCEGKGHHKGIINGYLQSSLLHYNEKSINNFFNDVEHGFFHGLMASFICYMINIDGLLVNKVEHLEKIFISATLHDFLKANGIEQKSHDKELRKVYPNLEEATYVHSDPPETYWKHHLIVADRLELRRYSDYKSWVDERFYELYKKMKPETKDMLDLFYTNLRPAMEYIYTHRKDTFIRHGTEVKQDIIEDNFPPSKTTYYSNKNIDSKSYPVEIDMVPFCSIINNTLFEGNKWYKDNQYGYSSNDDDISQWNIIKGYISIKDFIKNGKIFHTKERDHLLAQSTLKTNEWVFLHKNLDKSLDLNNVTSNVNYLESQKGINPYEYLSNMIKNNNKVISQETVFLLFQFIRMFNCRIVVLQ